MEISDTGTYISKVTGGSMLQCKISQIPSQPNFPEVMISPPKVLPMNAVLPLVFKQQHQNKLEAWLQNTQDDYASLSPTPVKTQLVQIPAQLLSTPGHGCRARSKAARQPVVFTKISSAEADSVQKM